MQKKARVRPRHIDRSAERWPWFLSSQSVRPNPSAALLLLSLQVGCGAGLDLTLVDSAYRRPSNVAVFFTVDTSSGEPVPGLEAADFQIFEDGRLVSVDESKQTIINQEVAAEHYTLLLVDMSGSVTESDQVPMIEQAASGFTSSLERHQKVAVYAFDGSEDIHPITRFRRSGSGVGRISGFRARDPSTNLHGAVVKGAEVLDEALEQADAPLRFGTLVIFTDGTDHASRVSQADMMDRIDESGFDIFAIGVGNEIDENTLAEVGRNGYVMVQDSSALNQAFSAVSQSIIGYTQRFYLLSYCSPARAGVHEVTIEALYGDGRGSLTYEFDAEGFGPRCNPETPPPFRTGRRVRRRLRTPRRGTRIEVRAEASSGF